ncbi:S8 family peptidase [Lachnospiraceae bacterium 45-P1]
MDDQKAENLLNLALSTPEEEREQTEELNVGFDQAQKTWELIVKYNGDLGGVLEEQFPQVQFRALTGGYAILIVPEDQVDPVIALKEIEFAEKPKRLYFAINRARAASCLTPVQTGADGLSGKGVLVAIVDSGIDYFHDDFRNEDGSSRILYLRDQVREQVYTKEDIDAALQTGSRSAAQEIVPSVDPSGHGTAVAGIAAGNGRESGGRYRGVAWGSELLVVRLGVADPEGFPRTTQIMDGLDFVVQTAISLGRPVAVNLSFGNSYGSHDGNGLFERYIDSLTEMGQSVFVIGTGNEGDAGGHTSGSLEAGEETMIELSVAPYETGFGVQLWKSYEDDIRISLRNPSGTVTESISSRQGPHEIDMGGARVLLYYGEPGPFNMAQEIYFDFLPKNSYVESGVWRVILKAERVVEGKFDLWLPSRGAINRSTRFLRPVPDTTLTIPSTALRPISVGAYDDSAMVYAAFSGRGDTRKYRIQKPDLVAPGVGIVTVKSGGGYEPVTGTSFAAPFVTGAAALLMEWGIIRNNDPYLYGEKVKAYLRRGAKPLPGFTEYPNPQVGYGALCVRDSLPE